MNLYTVRKALHVKTNSKWQFCSDPVYDKWGNSQHEDMAPVHQWISQNHSHVNDFKGLIYSGDNDAICATIGTQ